MLNLGNAGGFIFDCAGSLLDTLAAGDEAERDLFEQAGPLTQEQEDEIHSAPIEQAAAILHAKYGVGDSSQGVLAHLDDHLLPFYRDHSVALPGAVAFVRKVSQAGVPCVVVSSSPRRYLEAGLARAGILGCFRDLVTTDEAGCSKQEFPIYERALELLGSTREATWAVDDAPYALAVMKDFGLNTIAVGPRHDSTQADIRVPSLEALL
ncbi:MAG: HAD family phosphatase [Eggerthellaceae bacterium]|nr:HAD family phosphatase [Eggerthellaceae bacterium]